MIRLGLGNRPSHYASAVNWTPADITTAGWYDASDPSTITIATGVSQWDDKGGSNHLTQGTGDNQPTYSGSGQTAKLAFDGINDSLSLGGTGLSNATINIYTVRSSSDNACILYSDATSRYSHVAQDGSASTTITNSFGTPTLYTNGTAQSPTTRDDVHTLINTGSALIIGMVGANTSTWTDFEISVFTGLFDAADYHEIVITTGVDSTAQRQNIEGYLAHKWGLISLLDGGHPHKVNPPGR
jgi:hypothetical protein